MHQEKRSCNIMKESLTLVALLLAVLLWFYIIPTVALWFSGLDLNHSPSGDYQTGLLYHYNPYCIPMDPTQYMKLEYVVGRRYSVIKLII